MSLQLGLQPLEQGEGVGRGPGKAADHRSVAQPAHLAGIGLYHRLPQRDLSVARHHHLSVLAHRKNGRAVPACVVAHGISEEAVRNHIGRRRWGCWAMAFQTAKGAAIMRPATIRRDTTETPILVELNLEGAGVYEVSTGRSE